MFDRPSAPVGPNKFSEVTADSLLLSWESPLENGGAQITNYIVEKKAIDSATWQKVSDAVCKNSLKVFIYFTIYILYIYIYIIIYI